MIGVLRRTLGLLAQPLPQLLLVATLFSVASAVTATSRIYDPDVWWVAAAGRQMLATGHVPRSNLFSFTEPDHPWLMHEWLLGPGYALGLERFGPGFFVALALALLPLSLALILGATFGRTRHASAGLLLALGAVGFFGARLLSARPTGVALLFPLLILALGFSRAGLTRARALGALCVELVWTNAHGSFPLGVVLLALAALDLPSDRRRRALTAAGAALITLVNPYGLALHAFVFEYMTGRSDIYREIHTSIDEFRSLYGAWGKTAGPIDVLGLGLAALFAGSAWLEPRYRWRASVCLLLIVGAVFQARHIELAGLLTCLLLSEWMDARVEAWRWSDSTRLARRGRASVAVVGLAAVIGWALFAVRSARSSAPEWIARGPAFLSALAHVPDSSRLYVPFPQAGLAIWYGFPRKIRVYYDPRNDCYSARTSRNFLWLSGHAAPLERVRVLLDQTGTDAAVVSAGQPLAVALSNLAGWQRRFSAPEFDVFERRAR